MFAPSTYSPTYSGPITATGETMRRARNDSVAQGLSRANRRMVRPMQQGVRAGTGNQRYRTNLLAGLGEQDARLAGAQAYNTYAQENAAAGLQYQANLANEMAGLRDLMFSKRSTDSEYDLGRRQLDIDSALRQASRDAASTTGAAALRSGEAALLSGLLNSTTSFTDPGNLLKGRLITPAYHRSLTKHYRDR